MTWRYRLLGNHAHIRVYLNGALCGELCFGAAEFREFARERRGNVEVEFIDEIVPLAHAEPRHATD